MISKEEFVKIINRLRETDDIRNKVNDIFKNASDNIINDFCNGASLMICHEDIVVKLLENMFNDGDTLSYWIYERDYGRKFELGNMQDANGKDIDLTTPEKLYDYLLSEWEEKQMKCTDKEWDSCRVEKLGCEGCYYNDEKTLEKKNIGQMELERTNFLLERVYVWRNKYTRLKEKIQGKIEHLEDLKDDCHFQCEYGRLDEYEYAIEVLKELLEEE